MKSNARNELAVKLSSELVHNCADSITLHANLRSNAIALLENDTDVTLTWTEFDNAVNATAAVLLGMGLKKGEIIATTLPLNKEHVILLYACYRIGVIIAPLDLRLKTKDLVHAFTKMSPTAYFFTGRSASKEFCLTMQELQQQFPTVRHWVQHQNDSSGLIPNATPSTEFYNHVNNAVAATETITIVQQARTLINKRDPALIIFTTGSTGSPKPALLCHENILLQTIGFRAGFDFNESDCFLVNLPPSHVGCTTEQLGSIIYTGGKAVLLSQFDPLRSLQAISKHRITIFGQIPAMFVAEWRLSNFTEHDLSSVRIAMYGGQAVSVDFLTKLRTTIAHNIASGLGLTELAGFCTYTDPNDSAEQIAQSLGYDSPLCPISIREPMTPDGFAGQQKTAGEIGEICFSGPQVFLGYLGDIKATRTTVSHDGICYTGDLGSYDSTGLHFAGRAKLIIKPKGYQVFPGDIENHVAEAFTGQLGMLGCVGAPHELYTEGIMLFVEVQPTANITADIIMRACRTLPSYARPSHIEILAVGELPLNRVGKTDYLSLRTKASDIVLRLRLNHQWDTK